jgi:hypothetical protein
MLKKQDMSKQCRRKLAATPCLPYTQCCATQCTAPSAGPLHYRGPHHRRRLPSEGGRVVAGTMAAARLLPLRAPSSSPLTSQPPAGRRALRQPRAAVGSGSGRLPTPPCATCCGTGSQVSQTAPDLAAFSSENHRTSSFLSETRRKVGWLYWYQQVFAKRAG